MPTFTENAAHPVFDELQQALDHAATVLRCMGKGRSVSIREQSTGSLAASQRTYLLDTDGVSLPVRCSVFPLGETLYEVYVELDEGPTRRFTYNFTMQKPTSKLPAEFGRAVTEFLVDAMQSRIAHSSVERSSDVDSPTSVPRIRLDREGTIEQLNSPAQQTLKSERSEVRGRSILSLVHQQNMRRVMRDLARMVAHGQKRAEWLLRLRTAEDRWRWYRTVVQNRLRVKDTILVRLHPVGSARRNL